MGVKTEIADKRNQVIIDVLRGNPAQDIKIWECVREKKVMAYETYRRARNRLILDEKIKRHDIGRQVWLYLPEDETLFKERARLSVDRVVEDKEKIQLRITHTDDIKEKVIRPWLEQMRTKKEKTILTKYDYFSGESEPLFSDFKKHMKFKPDPFYELAHVQKIDKNFERRKYKLKYRVRSIISQVLEESPALFKTEPKRIKDCAEFIDEYDECRINLIKWIIELMDIRRLHSDDIETFDEIYLDFTSSVKENGSLYEYYVHDIYCGYIGKSDLLKEEFKEKMDECIKTILKQITESDYIKNEIEKLHKINILMEKHLNNMRASLERHLRLEVLPGDCEYYYWVQSK